MEPKIIFDKEFKIVGLKKLIKPGSNEFPELWGEFFSRRGEIKNEVRTDVALGLSEYTTDITNDIGFYYIACVEVTNFESIPEGMIAKVIPPLKYAIFTHKGLMTERNNTFDFIYNTWLPGSGYELAKGDIIELFDSRSTDISSSGCEFDIYIPLK